MERCVVFASTRILGSFFLSIPVNHTNAHFVIALPSVLPEVVLNFNIQMKDLNMMIKLALAAIIASVSMVSFAQDAAKPAVRAEVKSDAKAARKAGDIAEGDKPTPMKAADGPAAARADVKAGAKMARKDGAIMEGDKNVAAKGDGAKASKTRAESRAEAKKARKEGTIKDGEGAK